MPQRPRDRAVGKPRNIPKPAPFTAAEQRRQFGPVFNRLTEALNRDPNGLSLRADPTALAPERLLVFEVRGTISAFAAAIRRIPGLELIDEEELSADEHDKNPVAYLLVPDARALQELTSLWRRWQRGEAMQRGATPWRDVFALLRDIRPWGPKDRVGGADERFLRDEVDDHDDRDLMRLEVELVFRDDEQKASQQERDIRTAVSNSGGAVVSSARISDIDYHAVLIDLPVNRVRDLLDGVPGSLSALDPVMHIRPQSTATHISIDDPSEIRARPGRNRLGEPILALLDGVPVAAHPLLSRHLSVDDQFSLEPGAPVAQRVHGTAMASLIVHGDLNRREAELNRQLHVVPVLGGGDEFPRDRLIVDVIYLAIVALREGREATAPNVVIVNLSLGNVRRPFQGQLSAWSRLLDRLAYRYGILFVVSAGNHPHDFPIQSFNSRTAFEDAEPLPRTTGTLKAIADLMAVRRLLAPAETVNGVTVGGSNDDSVSAAERTMARVNIDPYPRIRFANPSSALGPGFANSVKPDILMPGAREHVRVVRNTTTYIEVRPAAAARSAGLRVASAPVGGLENASAFTNGTSAATALASRTAHRIYDALEAEYGRDFLALSHRERAVVVKALLVHPAKWPTEAAQLIRSTIGPASARQHVRQKDNIRRFLGYGFVDAEDAVACAADRATFWATGSLEENKTVAVSVPVPIILSGKRRPHALTATVAWFTPVAPRRRTYRAVRLKLLEPADLENLRVSALSDQPDGNQASRGTLFTRTWVGDRVPEITGNMTIELHVQREPDQGTPIDEAVSFGLAVTLTMPGVLEIYDQVRARLAVRPRARV